MKTFGIIFSLVFLFFGLIFITFIYSSENKNSTKYEHNQAVLIEKQSMKQIDSLTAAGNYNFTSDNAIKRSMQLAAK